MKEYVLSDKAVFKLLLHALKYPAATVNGLLVGQPSGGVVTISDVYPLLHNRIALSLPTEVALMQADAAAQAAGQQVVGYYQANERADDGNLGAGRTIVDSIASRSASGATCALLLNTSGLGKVLQQKQAAPLLQLLTRDGSGNWAKEQPKGSQGSTCSLSLSIAFPELAEKLQQQLQEGLHLQLADFEDHLEDITKNWLNPSLLT